MAANINTKLFLISKFANIEGNKLFLGLNTTQAHTYIECYHIMQQKYL